VTSSVEKLTFLSSSTEYESNESKEVTELVDAVQQREGRSVCDCLVIDDENCCFVASGTASTIGQSPPLRCCCASIVGTNGAAVADRSEGSVVVSDELATEERRAGVVSTRSMLFFYVVLYGTKCTGVVYV